MNIVIVSGSARGDSQSIRVAAWTETVIADMGHQATTIDISQAFVPQDSSTLFDDSSDETRRFLPIKQELKGADAVVIISPEWHGMPPGKLVSFFQSVGDSLAHIPALLITVSAARHGGAYPSEILRAHAGKNSRILWLPDYLIIRTVNEMLRSEPNREDAYIQQRLNKSLQLLMLYAETLKPVRGQLRDIMTDYPNGM